MTTLSKTRGRLPQESDRFTITATKMNDGMTIILPDIYARNEANILMDSLEEMGYRFMRAHQIKSA